MNLSPHAKVPVTTAPSSPRQTSRSFVKCTVRPYGHRSTVRSEAACNLVCRHPAKLGPYLRLRAIIDQRSLRTRSWREQVVHLFIVIGRDADRGFANLGRPSLHPQL